jgi:hypothetical protein
MQMYRIVNKTIDTSYELSYYDRLGAKKIADCVYGLYTPTSKIKKVQKEINNC